MPGIFTPHALDGKWAICDHRTDELLRHWRKSGRGLIWRGTLDEAESLCHLLNTGAERAPAEELSQTQKIHFMNVGRRKSAESALVKRVKTAFTRCEGCGSMVKPGHICPKGDSA
jgi:hypothetical protein